MSSSPETPPARRWPFAKPLSDAAAALGDWTLFATRAVSGVFRWSFTRRDLLRISVEVGYSSAGVVAVTGLFIGMVLAVQTYAQFHTIGMETSLGAVIHMSVVRELGPVLAAVMLAGRVGSAMAAELATMRVTEQLDALACLGTDPVKYLVAPRVLACVLLVPLLTVLADLLGLMGSSFICLNVYQIDGYHYWQHTQQYVKVWDVMTGLAKAMVFAFVLSIIACHRGFHGQAGAAGVGRAATEAFVWSFVAILVLDFFLGMFANTLHEIIWPAAIPKVA
jgi:phospholipid/cholesterol/gamma-HCH transport system permease protein